MLAIRQNRSKLGFIHPSWDPVHGGDPRAAVEARLAGVTDEVLNQRLPGCCGAASG